MRYVVAGLAMLAAACAPAPETPAPAPPAPETSGPRTLTELESAHDWQRGSGEKLNADWNTGVQGVLGKLSRPDAIAAIEGAGFACTYGEAHQDYPDPMAVCTRSFATRSCQMDWEISSTAEGGMVESVDGLFRRDCVGVDDDWPDEIRSAIDDQVAPAQPPPLP
jgi:opacity protein-like surface antigen